MKYIILLTDGMADEQYEELDNMSPLEAADIPFFDSLAQKGEMGLVSPVPEDMAPGSDVANLSLMGYDPRHYHNGRSSLEAISMGVELEETDMTFRCNLVTLSEEPEFAERTMIDYSAGEISTEESRELIKDLAAELNNGAFSFHAGISYRHLLLWHEGKEGTEFTPPHDITGKPIRTYLPEGPGSGDFQAFLEKGARILENHPVNRRRREKGLRPANGIWFWGPARKPSLEPFRDRFGLRGSVISAVDLIKGIGIAAGMESIDVEGATGTLHTNFEGKCQAAREALEDGADFVYLHIEAPDECGHQGDIECKIEAIEQIEQRVAKPLFQWLDSQDFAFRLMVLPDHPTPVRLRTHTHDPVPYLLYDSTAPLNHPDYSYSESAAAETGCSFETGWGLTEYFLQKK